VTHCNEYVNYKGKDITAKDGPKDTSGGKDLGPSATNSMEKFSNKELSPSATSQSANQ
jgi:hypothetical protein